MFHDAVTGKRHIPLQALPQARAAFEIRNSPLTESATVGFEFGYNVQEPGRLVVWEAQYGDFINGAQVIIDEFLTSGRAKWGLTPSLVLLLPHGYEGQGPDHSSARLERFLESAADINLRIANCTTAAQYFHLLRRQALLLTTDPLPLIVLTPKSLLRHPMVASSPRELAEGRWQPVIDDAEARGRARDVRRLVLCSGKIYVDLVSSEARAATPAVAVVPRRAALSVPGRGRRRDHRPATRTCRKSCGCRKSRRTWARGTFVRSGSRRCSAAACRCATSAARAAPARPKGSARAAPDPSDASSPTRRSR